MRAVSSQRHGPHQFSTVPSQPAHPTAICRANKAELVPVLLDACCAQSCKAVFVNGRLPGQEFLDRQFVALASLFKAQQPPTNRRDNFRLPSNNPPPRICRRQICDSKRTAIWPYDIFYPRSNQIGHRTLYTNSRNQSTPH